MPKQIEFCFAATREGHREDERGSQSNCQADVGTLLLILLGKFAILGKAVIGVVGLLAFVIVLPAGVSFVLDNVSLFERVGNRTEQSFVDLIRSQLSTSSMTVADSEQ